MERIIRKIEKKSKAPKFLRVAAYARVSSGKEAMLHSLATQINYYQQMIENHPGWMFCGVFADEAITGTKDSRENFQKLLEKCRQKRTGYDYYKVRQPVCQKYGYTVRNRS